MTPVYISMVANLFPWQTTETSSSIAPQPPTQRAKTNRKANNFTLPGGSASGTSSGLVKDSGGRSAPEQDGSSSSAASFGDRSSSLPPPSTVGGGPSRIRARVLRSPRLEPKWLR
eukprot:CAMPEP_0113822556 /NCGR_PEP_ID=MMETSP0328-20130328/2300_1 /TAXON_ID=39455 /ORGANISM="Alexandrium minutum" /LENGTH=114 /DNA_ID=CAMNT_0000790493 /DNA_START=191 /DNA_END=532 /DNA_ORIENTATION=+ /assembly_acc=CAM_ASM_000350